MKEWQIRQKVYHSLNTEYDDDLKTKEITITKNIVEDAIRYFKEKDIGWIYPSKSYMVAICYSRWLSENFGKRPLEYLNDESLLYYNDPYFKTYEQDTLNYIKILENVGWDFDENLGMVPDVKQYFLKEFMLEENYAD
jgi:hypothetical protein